MDSSMIGKIEKAIFYAQEPERTTFEHFEAIIKGDHKEHRVSYNRGIWHCDCKFFEGYRVCSHVMALERVLMGSVRTADAPPAMDSGMIGKIEKAIFYAQEPERTTFEHFKANIKGDHREHQVSYTQSDWNCDCNYYHSRGVCSHIMALERMLVNSVKTAEAVPVPA